MKKFLALLLSLLILLSVTACGSQPAQPKAEEPPIDFATLTPEQAAKVQLDIYLLAGQSNAAGTSTFESAKEGERDGNTYENVRYYSNCHYIDGSDKGTFQTFEAVREGMGYRDDRIGPELGMARVLNDKYATNDRKAVILKVAVGGTSLLMAEGNLSGRSEKSVTRFQQRGSWVPSVMDTTGSTDPDRPTGYLTRLLKETIAQCYAELLAKGFTAENIHFKSLCWLQGEEDRAFARKYYDAFPLFAKEIRDQVSTVSGKDYSALPIVMGEIAETFSSALKANVETNKKFINVQHKLAEADPAVTVIPSGAYVMNVLENGESVAVGTDNSHWNYHDMLEIGALFGNAAYEAK